MEKSQRCDRCWLFARSSSVISLTDFLSRADEMKELAARSSQVFKRRRVGPWCATLGLAFRLDWYRKILSVRQKMTVSVNHPSKTIWSELKATTNVARG